MSAVVDWLGDAALSAECLLEQAAVEYNTAQPRYAALPRPNARSAGSSKTLG